jgi:hypothetical protein
MSAIDETVFHNKIKVSYKINFSVQNLLDVIIVVENAL